VPGVAADALEPEALVGPDDERGVSDEFSGGSPREARDPDDADAPALDDGPAEIAPGAGDRRPTARTEPIPDVAGARPIAPGPRAPGPDPHVVHAHPIRDSDPSRPTCTAPQLRRFIKSRAYVPMHELRRRFSIDGDDDEVCAIDLDDGRIYVGLPAAEGRMLGELVRGGEVGYELSWDPRTPIVVGVYSMRPVTRA
jgi:hypothetical protein